MGRRKLMSSQLGVLPADPVVRRVQSGWEGDAAGPSGKPVCPQETESEVEGARLLELEPRTQEPDFLRLALCTIFGLGAQQEARPPADCRLSPSSLHPGKAAYPSTSRDVCCAGARELQEASRCG